MNAEQAHLLALYEEDMDNSIPDEVSPNLDIQISKEKKISFAKLKLTETDQIGSEVTRGSRAVMTWNNYPEDAIETLQKYFESGVVAYMCVGKEIAPTTGTPHLQGYIQWKKQTKFAALAKKWRCSFREAFRDGATNRAYCSKTRAQDPVPNEFFMEWGEMKSEGGRDGGEAEKKRWEDARQAAKEGRMEDIPADIYIRYCKNLEWIRAQNEERPKDLNGRLQNLWIYGPPGTGKSRLARMIDPDGYYTKSKNKWWDNYKGEESIVMDEIGTKDKEWIGEFLKIWGDRYAFNAETKGSSKVVRPKHIIVTANYSIDDCFPKIDDEMLNQAIHRRFDSLLMNYVNGQAWSMNDLETQANHYRTLWELNKPNLPS